MIKKSRKQNIIMLFALILSAIILIIITTIIMKSQFSANVGKTTFPVQINEIMSSNRSYPNEQGMLADWIELHNVSNHPIDLSGYKLTDNNQKIRYVFPRNSRIGAGEYFVVYCKKNAQAPFADFSIAKTGGESVILMTSRNVAIDHVETVALQTDESYAKVADGNWMVLAYGTPGFANSSSGHEQYLLASKSKTASVVINEVMSRNSAFPDLQGAYYDWIELHNIGTEPVFLSGYRLTDRLNKTGYQFSEGSLIAAGEYLLVYCDRKGQETGYAPFSISGRSGEHVLLLDQSGKVLEETTVPYLDENQSYARSEEGVLTASDAPTPGFENSESGFEAYLASISKDVDVRITEVMAVNRTSLRDSDGDFSDWIELTNFGTKEADLSGFYLSDRSDDTRRWAFPAIKLATGERVIIFCSGKDRVDIIEPHTNFSLNDQGETISVYSSMGAVICSLSYPKISEDQSFCLDENGGKPFITRDSTPGYPNTNEGFISYQSSLTAPNTLLINEVMTGNSASWLQSNGEYYDWVEFKNQSEEVIDLANYYITDRLDVPNKCKLPARRIAPGEVFAVLCTGNEIISEIQPQVAMSLNSNKETLYLLDSDMSIVDFLGLSQLPINGSYGRHSETGGFFYFDDPTPNATNKSGERMLSVIPLASISGGVYSQNAVQVVLTGTGTIHYTMDGSAPCANSPIYIEPFIFNKTTVLRAIAINDNSLPSRIMTETYFLNTEHDLPVVALTVDPEDIFGRNGITAPRNRYIRSIEKLAHVEYFFEGSGFSTDCGIRLHGNMSRIKSGRTKRSYKLLFRERYGVAPLVYPIFTNSAAPATYSIVLRNGSDALRSVIKDELITNIAARISPQLCVMDSRYCALYINGEYEGLYPLREGLSSGYYSIRYAVSKESVMIHRSDVDENEEFKSLLSYAANHELTTQKNYQYIESRVDIDSVIDWLIFQAYTANSDVQANVRYYRSNQGDGKWRYALYDLDYGMKEAATFKYLLSGSWNIIPRKLLKNPVFLDRFLTRFSYLMQHELSQENVMAEFDYLTNLIRSELELDRRRWPRPQDKSYDYHFAQLKKIILMDRAQQMKESLSEELKLSMDQIEAYFKKVG